jgi:hypothetical protein
VVRAGGELAPSFFPFLEALGAANPGHALSELLDTLGYLVLDKQWLAHAEAARGAYVDKLLARRLVLAEVLPAITAFSKLFGLSS